MRHVCSDEMAGSECRTQTELTSKNGGCDDTGKLARVVAWIGGMRTADTKEVKHGLLRLKHSATSDCADFETGHADRDLQIAVVAECMLALCLKSNGLGYLLLHDGDALSALDDLGGILTSGKVDSGDQICSVSVETANAASHCTAD